MLDKLWNFLNGYVTINIAGFSVAKVISSAAADGVKIWHVVRMEFGFEMRLRTADFERVAQLAREYRCSVEVISKDGLPMLLQKYKRRYGMAAGLILVIFGLYYLSTFIWLIEIEGNERLEQGEIIQFLEQNGIAAGTARRSLLQRDVEDLLIAHFGDIAWASVYIRGTLARIHLTETIVAPMPILDLSHPADIVAAKDGIILSIATASGTPKVRPGDVVLAGDVLVSSAVNLALPEEAPEYVNIRAMAEVWARMYYRIDFHVPFLFYEKSFTGEMSRVYNIDVNGRSFGIGRNRYENYELITSERRLSFCEFLPMPILLRTEEHREYAMAVGNRSIEEALFFAFAEANRHILENFDHAADILTTEITYTETEAGLNIELFIVTAERIDLPQAIQDTQALIETEDNI